MSDKLLFRINFVNNLPSNYKFLGWAVFKLDGEWDKEELVCLRPIATKEFKKDGYRTLLVYMDPGLYAEAEKGTMTFHIDAYETIGASAERRHNKMQGYRDLAESSFSYGNRVVSFIVDRGYNSKTEKVWTQTKYMSAPKSINVDVPDPLEPVNTNLELAISGGSMGGEGLEGFYQILKELFEIDTLEPNRSDFNSKLDICEARETHVREFDDHVKEMEDLKVKYKYPIAGIDNLVPLRVGRSGFSIPRTLFYYKTEEKINFDWMLFLDLYYVIKKIVFPGNENELDDLPLSVGLRDTEPIMKHYMTLYSFVFAVALTCNRYVYTSDNLTNPRNSSQKFAFEMFSDRAARRGTGDCEDLAFIAYALISSFKHKLTYKTLKEYWRKKGGFEVVWVNKKDPTDIRKSVPPGNKLFKRKLVVNTKALNDKDFAAKYGIPFLDIQNVLKYYFPASIVVSAEGPMHKDQESLKIFKENSAVPTFSEHWSREDAKFEKKADFYHMTCMLYPYKNLPYDEFHKFFPKGSKYETKFELVPLFVDGTGLLYPNVLEKTMQAGNVLNYRALSKDPRFRNPDPKNLVVKHWNLKGNIAKSVENSVYLGIINITTDTFVRDGEMGPMNLHPYVKKGSFGMYKGIPHINWMSPKSKGFEYVHFKASGTPTKALLDKYEELQRYDIPPAELRDDSPFRIHTLLNKDGTYDTKALAEDVAYIRMLRGTGFFYVYEKYKYEEIRFGGTYEEWLKTPEHKRQQLAPLTQENSALVGTDNVALFVPFDPRGMNLQPKLQPYLGPSGYLKDLKPTDFDMV